MRSNKFDGIFCFLNILSFFPLLQLSTQKEEKKRKRREKSYESTDFLIIMHYTVNISFTGSLMNMIFMIHRTFL